MSNYTANNPETNLHTAQQLGLLPEEFEKIKVILGRVPNFTELSIFSVMWSEHCSYKNSIVWLKTLPRKGGRLLVEAGEENAGLMDIGDGLACAFKIESHNHPSAIEPYQGAATGVGGIHRDIFTMGARPIAALNSLRFGNIKDPKTKHLINGIVEGIGHYGNAFGVPTVAGETYFDDSFQQNPLVNAMSVGIVKVGETISATAEGVGNPVFIVGSATGKDGIHGATFASADLTEESAEDLPSVQVGDPFQEKLLLEATLEVIKTGAVVGMQDMGAAGITCSTSEMSAKGNVGMKINLDKVPTRQKEMKAFEILLSESQERMLIVVKKGRENEVKAIFEKWDLPCEQIGEVTDTQRLHFYQHDELVADVPAHDLVLGGGAPVYHKPYETPDYFKEIEKYKIEDVAVSNDLKEEALQLIQLPNIANKRWIYNQYDSMVRTGNMSTNTPSDAAVIRIKDTTKALCLTVDCNSGYVHADPKTGAMIAVCEAARNIVCTGGEPLGVTNCLNFGNPNNPQAYYQFVMSVQGMGEACKALNTPVTGGNVSFYNQMTVGDKTTPVHPTPTIGMVGILDNLEWQTSLNFKNEKDYIYLIGDTKNDLGSSEYLKHIKGVKYSTVPHFNINEEMELHKSVQYLIRNKRINAAHDISSGGLFTALVEMGLYNELGFSVNLDSTKRKDVQLFGESQSRVLVCSSDGNLCELFKDLFNIKIEKIGQINSGEIIVDNQHWGEIQQWKTLYDTAIEKEMNHHNYV